MADNYTWNGGSIGWDDGFAAIKQLVEDCTGSKDARFLQETLDTIYLIATEEIATLQAALATEQAEATAMRRARDAAITELARIERMLPKDEPVNMIDNEKQAYNAWVAGSLIRAFQAAEAVQVADGSGAE